MLDSKTAISLLQKYGYTSTSVHPYLYKVDSNIGVCYSYIDEKFGSIERVSLFKSVEEMDEFLKKYQWYRLHGKENNITLTLDDYEKENPQVIYLRNGHVMADDEMFNLDKYEAMDQQKSQLEVIDRYLLECDNLINQYNLSKESQVKFNNHLKELILEQRKKYFDLQEAVDNYNKIIRNRKMIEEVDLNPEIGINIEMERALKERLSQYKTNPPEINEAIDFIKELWELNNHLEINSEYLKNLVLEKEINNDLIIANEKLNFIDTLNKKSSNFFTKKNLIKEFKLIEKNNVGKLSVIPETFIQDYTNNINLKYSYYDKIDKLQVTDYIIESKTNSNYPSLAMKYEYKEKVIEKNIVLSIDDVIKNIKEQFTKLNVIEQNSLILFTTAYKDIFNLIMNVPNYTTETPENIVIELKKNTSFTKLKKQCYDDIKNIVNLEHNLSIKKSIFAQYDFETLEGFIKSCINTIDVIKKINDHMILNSDIDVYFNVTNVDTINTLNFIETTKNIATVIGSAKGKNVKTILAKIKKNTPVISSPNTIDFGVGTTKMAIKALSNLDIIFDVNDVEYIVDKKEIIVSKYSSKAKLDGTVSVVSKLNLSSKNNFLNIEFMKRRQ